MTEVDPEPQTRLSLEMRQLIRAIPGPGGYWRADTELAFASTAEQLLDAGLSEDQALAILSGLYSATVADLEDEFKDQILDSLRGGEKPEPRTWG